MTAVLPLYGTRLVVLFLAIALSAVSIGAAFNAKKEFEDAKAASVAKVDGLKLGVHLDINTKDILTSGTVLAVAQLCILVSSLVTFIMLLVDSRHRRVRQGSASVTKPLSTRTLPLQLVALALSTLFAFAISIVVTKFVAERGVKLTAAFSNGTKVPQALVDKLKGQLGVKTEYNSKSYLLFLAVAPWFGFLFALIATIVTYLAMKRARAAHTNSAPNSVEKF